MASAKVYYFSDVLCVWAYVAQIRLDQIDRQFGDRIEIDGHFCSVFPDARGKIADVWKSRGGFAGFNAHLQEVAAQFPHIKTHDRVWLDVRPRTSTSAHLFLKAVQLIGEEDAAGDGAAARFGETPFNRASWAIRCAFFKTARDISDWHLHREIAEDLDIDYGRIEAKILSSEAVARLDADHKLAELHSIRGSPTFLMNNGRQKLYGNVGYRLIEANIEELLRKPGADEASWC